MAEEPASEKMDLSEVMLAMDVVDTLRHHRSLVERELQSEEREADLVERLRKLYADQGLEVSDELIAKGVKAMREERFAYRPPPRGVKTALARMMESGPLGQTDRVAPDSCGGHLGRLPLSLRRAGGAQPEQAGQSSIPRYPTSRRTSSF